MPIDILKETIIKINNDIFELELNTKYKKEFV